MSCLTEEVAAHLNRKKDGIIWRFFPYFFTGVNYTVSSAGDYNVGLNYLDFTRSEVSYATVSTAHLPTEGLKYQLKTL
jgi:hypothetical protein